jgi:tricorn protease
MLNRICFLAARKGCALIAFSLLVASAEAQTGEPVQLASDPALSPDGKTIVFAYHGELWKVPSAGGLAVPITRHPAKDREPRFSPDGKQIAFVSDREGNSQIFVMPAEGGSARQVTHHTGGSSIADWYPDGKSLLTSAARDHFWRKPERFFKVSVENRSAETPLFDDYGTQGSLSPDGTKLLFVREGTQWWRKGYKGSQSPQIWLYDIEKKTFTKLIETPMGAYAPIWKPDGKSFFYVGEHRGAMNLRQRELDGKNDTALTNFDDDLVVQPSLAEDGKTIVFRHLFDLYRLDLTKPGATPEKLEIRQSADAVASSVERRALTTASQASFSADGLEVAFIAGGDLWVMDTELCEPKRVTATPEEERAPAFAPDGKSILFVSDAGGQTDLWRAKRGDEARAWWENDAFALDRITNDAESESRPSFSPAGGKLSYVRGLGDLIVAEADGSAPKKLIEGWNAPEADWSPDGKWIVYALSDDDFNSDIWIRPIDGSKPPVNVSRHPDNDENPVWSPDGRSIAFTGRRFGEETDIYYLHLRKEDEDQSSRDRKLKKAQEKMKAARKKDAPKTAEPAKKAEGADAANEKPETKKDDDSGKKPVEVVIDFDGLADRLRRVTIPDVTESGLFWSPDSKKLAFSATIDGQRGTYTIEPPETLKPQKLSSTTGSDARWTEAGNQILWLANGVPSSLTAGGKESAYRFRALQEFERADRYRAGFDQAWRVMRDRWYDERLGNRNWDAIRRKYVDAAAAAPDLDTLAIVIQLMLGELNGSHLGFYPGTTTRPDPNAGDPAASGPSWRPETAHLGVRFDPAHKGPGLKIRDVLKGSPADRSGSRLAPGETILAIDDRPVDPSMDLTEVLNGPLDREIRLKVAPEKGDQRTVAIRPISVRSVGRLLYDQWIDQNRATVEKLSDGKLGYLHIRAMDQPSFHQFEQDLYDAGAGKEALVIDVRENGGGSTADLLLTSLTQPEHAFTVPRGGNTPGYPQDRAVFATWRKPIIVLCNQNSFSNAEIFSHAVKTLKRGKLVGVTTAGGVISTGGTPVSDIGFLRLPFRGWYLRDTGEDLELNGAVPDVILWPAPGDMPAGKDDQLAKAVELLKADVAAEKARPKPSLRKATAR